MTNDVENVDWSVYLKKGDNQTQLNAEYKNIESLNGLDEFKYNIH